MRRLLYLLPVLAFLALTGVFFSQLSKERDPSILPSTLIDQPAPNFVLSALEGRPQKPGFATEDLAAGQVTVVNVFASWCVPCLAEHPLVTRMAEDGFQVFGINHRDKDSDANRWLDQHGDPYTRIGADRNARVSIEWGVTGVPETFVIDDAGRIRYKHSGPITPTVLEEEILPILTELSG